MVWRGRSLRIRLTVVVTALVGVLFISAVLIIVAYERQNQRLLYNALYETIVVFARSIDRELPTAWRFCRNYLPHNSPSLPFPRLCRRICRNC